MLISNKIIFLTDQRSSLFIKDEITCSINLILLNYYFFKDHETEFFSESVNFHNLLLHKIIARTVKET